ncbi:YuzB family protein [Fodinisporobacter ferrooxydans]|uniref:YuzB family protein n=1 Tax=Fodinisporobacter ferrooxydans TaxID=2901836 RepID=A0ABY4CIC9_9BACL|nr:YuzB family protein [Alicyclobacillaceae bacterium MYW30-H2]
MEVCDINPICLLDIEALEQEYPGVSVLKTSCLSNCSICAETPFAYVNGEMLTADSPELLLAQIRKQIEEELVQ